MNNLDKIIEKINGDADIKIAEIHAECDREIARLQETAAEAIAGMQAETNEQAQKETAAILSRARAAASMKSREILLGKKAELIDRVYKQAEDAVYALPAAEYITFLATLTADAAADRLETVQSLREQYGDDEPAAEENAGFTVLLSAADYEKYGPAVLTAAQTLLDCRIQNAPMLTLSPEAAPISGGVVLRYGDIETCCSVAALLAGIREETDTKLAALLFG